MSDFENNQVANASATSDDKDKIRGRIPRQAWAYVRGLYELKGLTYEQIGNMYNSTPSAVFYVVQQARKLEMEPTLTAPTAEELQTPVKRPRKRRTDTLAWARAAVKRPANPGISDASAEQAQAILADPTAKRVFETTSKLLLDYTAWNEQPSDDSEATLKEAVREALRAISKIEITIATRPKAQANANEVSKAEEPA
jgi:hypothetical protein